MKIKRPDLYAPPWKMPAWMGFGLAGVFGLIALGSLFAIVHLLRPPAPPAASLAAAFAPDPKEAPSPAVAAADDAVQPEVSAPTPVKAEAKASKKAKKARHVAKKGKPSRIAKAARSKTVIASRNNPSNKKARDDLDKLLGL